MKKKKTNFQESDDKVQVILGCFMVVTFIIFSQGDWLFDKFMGVEMHD